jgi:UDP-N-acetylmuramyl pentapeptide phosphotransferase/UDP-N-acetylglucosamine-1-phosphate transferase
VITAPLVRSVLLRLGRVDVPNHRSSHTLPTPRGGGIACLTGVVGGAITAQLLGLPVPAVTLVCCVLVAVVGLVDDQLSLPALPRLVAQVALGGVAGWMTGIPALAVLGMMLFPVVVNTINFMDGINGITGMVSFAWGLTAIVLGARYGASALSLIGALTAGAALGFLPFNALTARLFLGDVGSYLFGALCAAGILVGLAQDVPVVPLVAPLALYLVDVFLTLGRRLRARESLTTAHRDHIYQRLTSDGLEHIQVAAIMFILSVFVAGSWVLLPAAGAVPLTMLAVASYVLLPEVRSKRMPQKA